MSCGRARTGLDKDTRLHSGHRQIADFRKRSDSENLGTIQQQGQAISVNYALS